MHDSKSHSRREKEQVCATRRHGSLCTQAFNVIQVVHTASFRIQLDIQQVDPVRMCAEAVSVMYILAAASRCSLTAHTVPTKLFVVQEWHHLLWQQRLHMELAGVLHCCEAIILGF